MILFHSDWQLYPNAIADYNTRNRSFVKLALIYKKMGIKNHSFHLSLMQPELVGVDPHAPDLPMDIRAKIAMECRYNPWYYFREVVRLPPHGGIEPVQFRANRGNIALFWAFFNHIDAANIQPRQTGKSASTDCLMVALLYILCVRTKMMMVTKDDQLRQANIERLKGIRDYLPKWLYVLTSDDRDNQKEVTCEHLHNRYVTGVARSSESAASNLGRGLSVPILQVDEGPFISHIETTMRAALVAGNAARAEAARHQQPYGNIFTTTAGKIDDRDGRYMYNFIMGGTVWTESFLDARNLRELRFMVERNAGKVLEEERKGKRLLNITMSHLQLGYDDKWLYQTMQDNDLHGEDADRDLLNIWTRGSRRSPLSLMLNESILHSEREVLHTSMSSDGYMMRWYVPEAEIQDHLIENQFVLSMDTSEAVGRDAIAMTLINLKDLGVDAVGTFNETNIERFVNFLAELIIANPTITVIIERKSTGQTIYDMLVLRLIAAGIDPFRRLFNSIVDNYLENEKAFEELNRPVRLRDERFYEKRKSTFGFVTTASSRLTLYTTVLQNAAKRAGHLVRDKTLSSEIRHLVEKNGRIDHDASGHDDHCFIASTLVRTDKGNRPIGELKIGDLVLTREGYKPIRYIYTREKEVIEKFGLVGTADHPFITPIGEVKFEDLTAESPVYVWNEKQSCIEEKRIIDTLTPQEDSIESITIVTTDGKHRQSRCIVRFGKTFTDLFRKACKFIIKTTTRSITTSTTSNVFHQKSIDNNIQSMKPGARPPLSGQGNEIRSGNGVKRILIKLMNFIERTVEKVTDCLNGEKTTRNLQEKSLEMLSRKVSQSEPRREIVYNLLVDECHEYFVNDILVHNCIAWLLGHWFATHAKNLSYYGIDTNRLMTHVGNNGKKLDDDAIEEQERQKRYQDEFEETLEMLRDCTDPIATMKLEHRVKTLGDRIQQAELGGERGSIDAMIRQVTDERRNRARLSVAKHRNPRQEGLPMFGTALGFDRSDAAMGTRYTYY